VRSSLHFFVWFVFGPRFFRVCPTPTKGVGSDEPGIATTSSAISPYTGLATSRRILAGERTPQTVAKLTRPADQATESTIAKSLVGDYRRRASVHAQPVLASYRHYQELIGACDKELSVPETFESKAIRRKIPKWKSQDGQKTRGGRPSFYLQIHLYLDLRIGPDKNSRGAHAHDAHHLLGRSVLISRGSPTRRRSRAGWDSVRITGSAWEKVLSVKTRNVKNRAATHSACLPQSSNPPILPRSVLPPDAG